MNFSTTYLSMNPGEFPHSEISGSMLICSSPKLIAAYHVFHRLPVPRHSPCALVRLTFQTFFWNIWYPLDSLLPTKIIVTLPFEIVIFLKKELTIIFVSQLLFSFQGTSLKVLSSFRSSGPSKSNNIYSACLSHHKSELSSEPNLHLCTRSLITK